jgi:hypothetical protein
VKTQRLVTFLAAAMLNLVTMQVNAQEAHPVWAYPMNPPDFKAASDDASIRRVPDSAAGYTLTQTRDRFAATDWHPGITRQCPRSWRGAESQTSLPAVGAIVRMGLAGRKTQTSWASRMPISCNR